MSLKIFKHLEDKKTRGNKKNEKKRKKKERKKEKKEVLPSPVYTRSHYESFRRARVRQFTRAAGQFGGSPAGAWWGGGGSCGNGGKTYSPPRCNYVQRGVSQTVCPAKERVRVPHPSLDARPRPRWLSCLASLCGYIG